MAWRSEAMEKCYYHDYECACEPPWVGMKRGHEQSEGKLDAAVMEKRHRCEGDDEHPRWKAVAAYAPSAGTKRGYERSEEEVLGEEIVQRYKCNYWEDPAYARSLQLFGGGRKAKHAALINQSYRLIKETDAWLASLPARST